MTCSAKSGKIENNAGKMHEKWPQLSFLRAEKTILPGYPFCLIGAVALSLEEPSPVTKPTLFIHRFSSNPVYTLVTPFCCTC